jgi:putative hydrolase of the HAD superfamily
VVFVDLDGTIMRGPFESAVFPAVLGELARKTSLDVSELRRLASLENLERQRDSKEFAARAMDWDDILSTVAERLGVTLETRALEIARSHAGPPDSAILDHADQVLKQLASLQRAIVVATKGLRKYQLPVLDALGLTPLFTEILTPDVNNALKNDLAFYGRWPASTRLQISVGDHYEDDVVAPKRFGFKVVWKIGTPDEETMEQLARVRSSEQLHKLDPFERPTSFEYAEHQTVRPDAIIFSLRELPEVVERLESQ